MSLLPFDEFVYRTLAYLLLVIDDTVSSPYAIVRDRVISALLSDVS
jgi:hypothetical protein